MDQIIVMYRKETHINKEMNSISNSDSEGRERLSIKINKDDNNIKADNNRTSEQ